MTYTYHASTNTLKQVPTMEKPGIVPERYAPYSTEYYACVARWRQHENHLASLKEIPCEPGCKEVWKDGQEVEEKDFEVRPVCIHAGSIDNVDCLMNVSCDSCAFLAIPIKAEREDDPYGDVVTLVGTFSWDRQTVIAELKQKFTITKR
jgi:hypothetical protein